MTAAHALFASGLCEGVQGVLEEMVGIPGP